MTIFRFETSLLLGLALSSCAEEISNRALICDDMPGLIGTSPRPTSAEQLTLIDQCIHKWGARLSLSSGTNSEIARAAIYRCRDGIRDYYSLLKKENSDFSGAAQMAWDKEFEDMALMRVIQQRAGQCSLRPEAE